MKLTCKAILLSLLFPAFLNAQEVGLLRLKPERPEKEGTVAVWGGVEQGWFRPTYEGTLQWSAGARASGVRHGEKTSWTGSVSLEQKTGYGMLSSMLLEPGYFPVDLLEFTPGTKSREIGRLEGGFVTDLGYECAIGLKASLQAGYVGKRTDLRHSAFGMGLRLEPTITYVMDDDMGLAAAYVFRLKTERVQMHGDSENTAFLDKGLRYGTYVDGAGAFPIQEMSHGFAGRFYSEEVSAGLEWLWKRGQAGATGVGSFRFPGSSVSVFYEQAFQAEKADHVIRLFYGRDRDQLREAVSESGFTAVSDRLGRNAEIKYEARFLHGAVRRLGIALEGHRQVDRAQSPLWDQVKRNLGTATLFSSFSFGAFELDIEALAGGGLWRDRGRSRDETADMPYRRTEDWLRLMDYSMAPRVGAGGALTYHVSGPKGLFFRIDGRWLHALRTTAMGGQNRGNSNLTIGYDF